MLASPLALAGWLPTWDIERRHADVEPLVRWTIGELTRVGVRVDTLDSLRLDGERARTLAQGLTAQSLSPEFRVPFQRALRSLIPELPWERVWVQTYAHFRILVPGDASTPVPPHTDYGFAHGLEERNVWIPLTDAEGPAALHLASLNESLTWMTSTGRVESALYDIGRLRPHETQRGECLLFTPLHLHGARMPSRASRVSIDVRIVPAPEEGVRPDFTFTPLLPSVPSAVDRAS